MRVRWQPHQLRSSTLAVALAAVAALVLQRTHRAAAERHIAAAAGHICVVQDGGGVECRGNTTSTGKLNPPAGVAFHAVTVGDDFSCGLTAANGSLRCWGALPGGSTQLPPVSTFFIDAHAGPRHVCGLVPNGTVYCYGDASSRGAVNVPVGVAFQGVTAGANYTCGVARNHSVVCWGDVSNPVVAATTTWQAITDAEHVAAGADHACYVRVNGSVACWGSNVRGGATPPTALMSNGSVWWLAVGGGMTCAASGPSVPGPVTCWGAVNGTITVAGYEVACAGWGCVASTSDTGSSARLAVAAAIGGSAIPDVFTVVVTTLAGNGTAGTTDGVGTNARFNGPLGVSLDGAGRLYVADYVNHAIRRMDIATRNVTTVAGVTGTSGRVVGATPLQSTFYNPIGVEVDGAGNVYVADTYNHAIRMLSGVWVAGSTTGVNGSVDSFAGTSAMFYMPLQVRADVAGGLLYVADTYNFKVRTIATDSTHKVSTLVTFTGNVRDIALNPAARVMYVAVASSVHIVTFDGVATLLAGSINSTGIVNGPGTTALFSIITVLALDASAGVLYAADYNNHLIRRINTTAGGLVTTLAGSGSASLVDGVGTAASFYLPHGIALATVSNSLYIGDNRNHAIRQVQLQSTPATLATAPLPPSPGAPSHQLTAWRALGASNSLGAAAAQPVLDARTVTFSTSLAPANTAGLHPAIGALLLGNVTLAQRDATPAAASNTNTTFSTSAQRGLRSLTLTTPTVPAAALALPALTNLTLVAPSTQQLQLTNNSFVGLATLSTLAISNINNVSWPFLSWLPAVPALTSLDLSGNAITTINEHDFDAARSLRWLSLADTALAYVSDAAFSTAKQPALAVLDQSRTQLVTGAGCPPGFSNVFQLTPAGGTPYVACRACPSGASCIGGANAPAQCGANTYATGGAAACTPCPPSTYATGAAKECVTCPPGFAAPACNATASWRDTTTLVTDDAGSWVNASIYLAPAGLQPATANVSCGPVVVVSTTTVSCVLPFLLPAATTAPVLTQVWGAHAGTGGILQRLNAPVILLPPPLALVPGGGIGLAPHTTGTGRIMLRLPKPRLVAADWDTVGLSPPPQATIDGLAVWLNGAPCTERTRR